MHDTIHKKKKNNVRHIIAIYMGLKNIIISYLYQGRKKEKKRNLPFLFLLGRVVLFIPLCLKHCFVKVSGLCAATFSFLFLFLDDSVLTTMQEGNSNLIKESKQCHCNKALGVAPCFSFWE